MRERVRARASAMMVVYERATGAAFERWPVDASEMLATGDYTTEPIAAEPAELVAVAPVSESPIDAPKKRRGKD